MGSDLRHQSERCVAHIQPAFPVLEHQGALEELRNAADQAGDRSGELADKLDTQTQSALEARELLLLAVARGKHINSQKLQLLQASAGMPPSGRERRVVRRGPRLLCCKVLGRPLNLVSLCCVVCK